MQDNTRLSLEVQRKLRYTSIYLKELSGERPTVVQNILNMPSLKAYRVCEVNNKYMKALYELKKAEYIFRNGVVCEKRMYITTSAGNAVDVAQYNFNWREFKPGDFGAGVKFSYDPCYSMVQCTTKSKDQAMIVVDVLVSKTCPGYSFMDFPLPGCDTVCDISKKVFLKFHDNEFLPLYVIFFDTPGCKITPFFTKPPKWVRGA